MSELVLFGEELPQTTQSTPDEAALRAERIRVGMVAIATLADEVKSAWTSRDWVALSYASWDAYVDGEFGEHRLPMMTREQRRDLAVDLRSGSMSTRAIAAVLGVDQKTVVNDLRATEEISSVERLERITGIDGRDRPATRQSAYGSSRPSAPPFRPASAPAAAPVSAPWQAPMPAAPVHSEPSMFDDHDIVDAEIVEPDAPAPWIENAAREAAEQLAEVKATFDEAAQREAELSALPGAETFDQRIRREQPYANAAIKIRQAIEEIPLHLNPADLAGRVPDYSEHNVNRLPEALAWLAAFNTAYQARRTAVA